MALRDAVFVWAAVPLLPEAALYVILGALVFGVGKDGVCNCKFDHGASAAAVFGQHPHGGVVRDARCLLHVVGDDDDGVARLEVLH